MPSTWTSPRCLPMLSRVSGQSCTWRNLDAASQDSFASNPRCSEIYHDEEEGRIRWQGWNEISSRGEKNKPDIFAWYFCGLVKRSFNLKELLWSGFHCPSEPRLFFLFFCVSVGTEMCFCLFLFVGLGPGQFLCFVYLFGGWFYVWGVVDWLYLLMKPVTLRFMTFSWPDCTIYFF